MRTGENERLQTGLVTIWPLGRPELMPAVFIGYDSGPFVEALDTYCRDRAHELPHPRWWVEVEQQSGGLVMSYPRRLGLMLRLEPNADQAVADPTRLLRGLRAMAEDSWDGRLLESEYPRLHACTETWGEDFTPVEREGLHAEVSEAFRLPAFDAGLEACVRFEPCDLMHVFGGWRVLGLRTRRRERPREGRFLYEDGSPSPPRLDDDTRLTPEVLHELQVWSERAVGQTLPAPRAWLLWENSD